MFLSSFSSYLSDTLNITSSKKYKFIRYSKNDDITIVDCEVIKSGQIIQLSLSDIFKKNKLQHFDSSDILLLSDLIRNQDSNKVSYKKPHYYYGLGLLFTMCLLVSNLAATKLCDFWGYILPGGTVFFPMLYIINDILTEVYGFKASRKVIAVSLICNFFVILSLYFIIYIPPASINSNSVAFESIFAFVAVRYMYPLSSFDDEPFVTYATKSQKSRYE